MAAFSISVQRLMRPAVRWLSFTSSMARPTNLPSASAADAEKVYSSLDTLPINSAPESFRLSKISPMPSQKVSEYDSESPQPNSAMYFPVRSVPLSTSTVQYKILGD